MAVFIVLTLAISALIGWTTIPNIVIISKRKRLFDSTNARKVHTGEVPRLGGLSFMPAVIISFCFSLGMSCIMSESDQLLMWKSDSFIEILFFVVGLVAIFFFGLADDLVGISYKSKFLVQTLAAMMPVFAGLGIKSFDGLFGIYQISPLVGIPLTVFVVVGAVNAYNLIDGIDGLCSGLGAIALSVLSWWFYSHQLYVYAMLGVSLLGCVIIFFRYNTKKLRLKVFMGDSGSLMLGYVISFLGLKFLDLNVSPSPYDFRNAEILMLSVIFVPVFDTVRVFTERIMRKRSPFMADNTHIHHILLSLGRFSHIQVTMIIMAFAIALILLNFTLRGMESNLLLSLDVVLGMVFLNLLPKFLAAKAKKQKRR